MTTAIFASVRVRTRRIPAVPPTHCPNVIRCTAMRVRYALKVVLIMAAGTTHAGVGTLAFIILCGSVPATNAVDIPEVLPVAIDQPQIFALLRRTETGDPLTGTDPLGSRVPAIQGFYDTGASGVILSQEMANSFGVMRLEQPTGTAVLFQDVGVGGSAQFNVSQPLFIGLAPGSPVTDPASLGAFTQQFGPLNMQVGPLNIPGFPGNIDVFGMPTMAGKVIVMDSRNVRLPTVDDIFVNPTAFPGLRTYTYDPGTPFRPTTDDTDPGIPVTNQHVPLSYSNFQDFTLIEPEGAQGPTLTHNPFIGPAPVPENDNPPGEDTPGVTLTFGDERTTGSFLLDTGAQTSFISTVQAASLNVRYVAGTQDTPNPLLELFDPADGSSVELINDQITTTVTGIGGTETLAGFFVDSLVVKTLEGDPLDDDDAAHLRYLNAPLFVNDIGVTNPVTGEELLLDGIFGMNYLTTSADVVFDPITGLPISIVEGTNPFQWIVFDEPNGILGMTTISVIPIPATGWLLLSALLIVGAVGVRKPLAKTKMEQPNSSR